MTQPPPGYGGHNQTGNNTSLGNVSAYSQMSQGSPLLDEINNESEIEFVDENNTNNGEVIRVFFIFLVFKLSFFLTTR